MGLITEFHTAESRAWVDALVEVVRGAVRPHGFIGRLGYRLWGPWADGNPSPGHLLCVFPTGSRVVGGPYDGADAVSGFDLDMTPVFEAFRTVRRTVWRMPSQYNNDLDGPEVLIDGLFLGRPVTLRVFHVPPPDEPLSHTLYPTEGRAEERPEDAG